MGDGKMRSSPSALRQVVVLGLASLPVLAVGTCQLIAQQAVINGFFDVVTPLLVEHARSELGLPTTTTQTSKTPAASASR